MRGVVIILILCLVYYFYYYKQGFKPCSNCGDIGYSFATPSAFVNPYYLPYSGTQCTDWLYNSGGQPAPTHMNTPDHVVLTN